MNLISSHLHFSPLWADPTKNNFVVQKFNQKLLPVNRSKFQQYRPHIESWLEGFPSGWWGTCTSSSGRKPFCLMRYIYLISRKETLLVDEVHLPHQQEGNPSGWWGTCTNRKQNLAGRALFFRNYIFFFLQFYSWIVFDFFFLFMFLK
jgi:hypothetical protein